MALDVAGSIPVVQPKNYGILGSPVTPPALGAGELAGSNPAIPTKINRGIPKLVKGTVC